MTEGLRVELTIDASENGPVADTSNRPDGAVTSRTRSTGEARLDEAFDCAVSDVQATDGQLRATVHVDDAAQVRSVVDRLRESFDGVIIHSFQQDGDGTVDDAVLVDRGQLTGRQREVLETAHDMGYFEYPKGANAGEVATALDISVSTFAEHLGAAQTKVLGDLLDGPSRE